MKFRYLLLLVGLIYTGDALAAMYKRVEPDGTVTYTNEPIKGGKKITLDPLPTIDSRGKQKSGHQQKQSSQHTRVKPSVQKERDEARRKILEDELAAEEKLLAEAQQKLKDEEGNPRMWRRTIVVGTKEDGTPITKEITGSNAGLQQENVKAAKEEVERHQKNIEAIKTELNSSK